MHGYLFNSTLVVKAYTHTCIHLFHGYFPLWEISFMYRIAFMGKQKHQIQINRQQTRDYISRNQLGITHNPYFRSKNLHNLATRIIFTKSQIPTQQGLNIINMKGLTSQENAKEKCDHLPNLSINTIKEEEKCDYPSDLDLSTNCAEEKKNGLDPITSMIYHINRLIK